MEKEKYQFAYVMDQQVGLKTHAQNIARVSEAQPDVHTTFVPVCYTEDTPPLSRLQILPESVRSTMRGVHEIRQGLASNANNTHYDAVLWATWAAKSVLDCVERWPAYWMMDMTPDQMKQMGEFYGYSNRRAEFMQGFKRRSTDRLYGQVRHFFPWSTFVADSLIKDYGIPAEKITVTSPGTNTTLFAPLANKPKSDKVRILFVGGDFERKGGDLLNTWATGRDDIELHVVTRDNIEPAPNLHIYHNVTNNSPELVALYQMADIFVLPTRADCYSLVSMEAMSCGVPVVVSKLGGIPDIVTEGETGFLMPPGDGEAMGRHLDLLVSDSNLRQTMGQKSREKAVEKFNSTKNIETIIEKMRSGC
jgi:glycosyltransferase involved in cell wall biosynthesis